MKKSTLIILAIVLIGIISGAVYYFNIYSIRKDVSTSKDIQIFIPTGSTIEDMYKILGKDISNIDNLKKVAQQKGLNKVYPGRYTFKSGATNEEIVRRLQSGEQDEIEIMIGNYQSIYELAQKIDPFFEISGDEIIKEIMSRQEMKGRDTLQAIYFLSPNTYRFHWNNSAAQIIDKISAPFQQFWNDNRMKQLSQSGMTQLQVITLASIVQLESYRPEEQPKVAGVYLNRLKKGMKLQADPTVLFAKKSQHGWDLKIKRIYYKDLNISSPYNTYQNTGLPPGPICMPNPSAIEAVLNPDKHDYIYFVADTTQNGLHIFASDYVQHEKNAEIYRNWADRKNIK